MKSIKTKLKDAFSGCTDEKIIPYSAGKFEQLTSLVGKHIDQFDKVNQIHFTWLVVSVELLK